MKKKFQNKYKKGAALPIVIVIFLTMVVILTSAIMMTNANMKRSKKTIDYSSAYHIAESGINIGFREFKGIYSQNNASELKGAKLAEHVREWFDSFGHRDHFIGEFMGQKAYYDLDFYYDGVFNNAEQYTLYSKGVLGDTVREVYAEIRLEETNEPTIYQPDGMITLDPDNHSSMTIQTKDFMGPMITNKETSFINMNPTYRGPLVTNKPVNFQYAMTATQMRLISSSEINVLQAWQNVKPLAIVMKPGATINYKYSNGISKNLNPKYIFVPKRSSGNYDDMFLQNGVPNATIRNYYLNHGQTKVFYYEPENWDPYLYGASGQMTLAERREIFGESPEENSSLQFNYRDYFETDFVLDNMDKEELVNQYRPNVVMPEKPKYEDFYPYGGSVTPEYLGDVLYIDANNNLSYQYDWRLFSYRTLNWKDFPNNERSFNSINIRGGEWSEPTTIDIGDEDVSIITKSFKATGYIRVKGKGKLRIYVIGSQGPDRKLKNTDFQFTQANDFRTITPPNINPESKPEHIQFLVYESESPIRVTVPNIHGGPAIGASFFSENLNLEVYGDFRGHFVSARGTSIIMRNSGSSSMAQLVYAPQAELRLEGGHFTGVITVKDFYSANAGISYEFSSAFDKSLIDEILPNFITGGKTGISSKKSISIGRTREE